jgi:hypothetical protein
MNQKLPTPKRLRVLAGDPPIDWDQVKTFQDGSRFFFHREDNIASVMEKEVLSKHRKALMLFGTFHLMHGTRSAVAIYEKDYPNVTLIISELGNFDTDLPALSSSRFVTWPVPSLARAKGTWLGALDLGHFLPLGSRIDDRDCTVHNELPKPFQRSMADLVDAFLYLGPQDLRLKEKMPADVALDLDYMKELQRREALPGSPEEPPERLKEFLEQIVSSAENPLFMFPKPPDPKLLVQSCLDRKSHSSTPQ